MKKRFKRIYIEITNSCNRNCYFCSKDTKKKRTMTLEEFEHILKEINDYTDYVYLHVKGEPLLHPNFKGILSLCKKYNKYVNITTNGTLLLSRIDDIIDSKTVRQINVSLHNFKDEPAYLKDILEATDKLLMTPIYINYRFWTLQDNKLTSDMREMIEEILSHYHLDTNMLSKISEEKNIKLTNNLYLNKGDLFDWPSLDHEFVSETGTCYGTRDHLGILSDGTVIPCCLDSSGIIDLGNIYEESFPKILTDEAFTKMNDDLLNNHLCQELCQKCTYRKRFDKS